MTEQGLPRSCPEAAVLAAFAEGSLPAAERREVAGHVAMCPECPAIVGATIRYLAEEDEDDTATEPPRSPPRHLVAAAVAIAVFAALSWQYLGARDPMRRLRAIASDQPARSVEGHLHRFPHAPFSEVRDDAVRLANLRLRAEEQKLATRNDPAALHARGIALLLTGRPDDAVAVLAPVAKDSNDFAVWNDLATAQLARMDQTPTVLTEALRAAEHAARLEPSAAAPHYNRGLALERLRRCNDAIRAYEAALAREQSDAWRADIRNRLQLLRGDC